ncbi:ATP-dependent helicase [Nesterenkonia alba]|uniref:ATP-dependent helicase n=1 Tax=Nesterenkonia alba TaxID=515814 RepID=UPI0003B69B0F|nr:ATP-dependent helicase [Nesterenkonia alba]
MALERFTEATRTWFTASFGEPTAAQAGAWEAVSKGKNALVVAPTGSGKTLAAFLWAIDRLMAGRSEDGTGADSNTPEQSDDAGSSPPAGTEVLYISPLKALGVDIERNLRSPLVGIGHTARRLGTEPREISVGVRTGDTTAKQRRDLVRRPPEILITTPESLYLMLTSQARATLTGVNTVIVDEVHAVAGTKRGAHLAVSLERLDALLDRPAQRIGLSATVEPQNEVARFLGGTQAVDVVAPASEKQWDITVSVPVPDMAEPEVDTGGGTDASQPLQPSIWPHVEHKVVELITQNRSTIVFVNSRRLAEKLTGRINEIHREKNAPAPEHTHDASGQEEPAPGEPTQETTTPQRESPQEASGVTGEDLARSHHGSVSKEQRALIEEDLKAGRLRCVVATSSLELGIDMGAVDLVIQVEAPPAVSAGLQRIGRAGHHVGEVSVGWFFPKHRGDLVSTAVVVERMLAGQIEALRIPANPLDILAQQTVAAAAMETLDVEAWYDTLRRAAPFTALPRSAYESTLDLLAGKYPSDRFAELRPRLIWDRDAGTLTGRPGAQRLAVTSGGTIPDRGLFGVYLVGGEDSRTAGRRVGELDEEMVYESRVGDVFALGATSWRIEEITFDRVLVSPAFGQPGSLPFWRGDGLGRPAELGRGLGEFIRQLRQAPAEENESRLQALGMDTWARDNLLAYLQDQHRAAGAVPDDRTLVVERTRDELGDWRIILHSPFGMGVHSPWALAVGQRLTERYGLDGAAFAADDGIVLRVPMMDEDPPGAELFRFEPEELEEIVTAQVSASAVFAARFRETAARALLLPRQNPGARTPLWQQRQRASQLLEVASGYPSFPLIMETMREVLQDVYDMPALLALTRDLAQRRMVMVETTTTTPSPFAQSLLFGYIAEYLYEGDSPMAERRAAALSVDPQLLNELLGRVELREVLDAEVIAEAEHHVQRLSPSRRLRGVEGVADLLRLLGPLTGEELAARLQHPEDEARPAEPHTALRWAEELVGDQRAFAFTWHGQTRYAAVEDAARLRDGLGAPIPVGLPQVFLDPVEDPLGDLVFRYARTHGPFTTEEAASALHLPRAAVEQTLHRLVQDRLIVEGLFRPDRITPVDREYCSTEMLQRIRRRSLAALRAAVEPVPPTAYAQFLTEWQSTAPQPGLTGLAGLAEALSHLSGAPLPASGVESYILPARVADYQPGMLDELIRTGEVLVVGHGALSGHDGWVRLVPRHDAEALITAHSNGADSPLQQEVLNILRRGGAWFPEALHHELTREVSTGGDPVTTPLSAPGVEAVKDTLWELFWAAEVTVDSFAPIRARLAAGRTAHRKRPVPSRTRHASRRMALRRAVEAHRGSFDTPDAARWQLIPHTDPDPTEAAHLRAEILLDRYGVLTRGSVAVEDVPGGFAGVYKVLNAAEEAGRVRRGYFIEHLGAAQFAASSTVDRLREIAEAQEDARSAPTTALAAADPANPYGAALLWPELKEVSARPGRKAGAVVVLHAGELVAYVERGGRTVLIYTEDHSTMEAAAQALVTRLQQAGSARIAVERINTQSALEHPFAEALKSAGFRTSPSGLRFSA